MENKLSSFAVYDSSGKQGPGMILGGLTEHGNYDECLNTRHYEKLEPRGTLHVQETQYCSVFFSTPSWILDFINGLVRNLVV